MPAFQLFRQLRLDAMRAEERRRGEAPSLLRFSSARAASSQVENPRLLPCAVSDAVLQDAEGRMLWLEGYSHPSGPDRGAGGLTGDDSSITGDDTTHTGDGA
jgi:hypothetical protein